MIVYQHAGLTGLEIWHGLARHTTLYQLRDDKSAYYAGLAEFLRRLHAGTAENLDGEPLGHAAGFAELWIAGGEAAALDFPHHLLPPDPFCARRGAEAIWAEYGWRRPVAIDLGQTQLKLMTRATSLVFPRRLPYGRAALPEAEGRERLRAFVGEALAATGPHDGVVLGLPNRLNAEGVAEASTYPGLYGPVAEVFGDMDWVVVNDAVLTARGYPPAEGTKRLVITMGFGVGAALWHG